MKVGKASSCITIIAGVQEPSFPLSHVLYCCSVPPGYVYPSPYLTAAPSGIVPLPPAPVSHAAALAAAAAATSQFYEYQNAAAAAAVTYPGQYPNGFETYPYTTAAGGWILTSFLPS